MSETDPPFGDSSAERSLEGSTEDVELYPIDEEESVAHAVIVAVSHAEGIDPTGLTPLLETLDGDALDALVASARREGTGLRLRFPIESCEVEIHATPRPVIGVRTLPSE